MHNCARYLIFFQYIGTKYCGAAKVPPYQLEKRGILNYLEDALKQMKPLNPVSVVISSRTDSGVHALSNSAHFDFQRRNNRLPHAEEILVKGLNYHLKTEQIRITRAYRVRNDFHARFHAQSRTYVYRIALGVPERFLLPLTDHDLSWNLHNAELDVGAMREAAALLAGTHNFSSFGALSCDTPYRDPVRKLEVADIQPGSCFTHKHFHRDIPIWELTFKSRAFLYRQVRRMTGALVGVGQGRLSVPQLKEVLEAQDSLAFPRHLLAPPQGLFLTKVEYRDTDLQFSKETSQD